MSSEVADPEVEPSMTAAAHLKKAREALHTMMLSIDLDASDPAAISPLGPISVAASRLDFLRAFRSIRQAQAVGNEYGHESERVARTKQDAASSIDRTQKAMDSLAKVVEVGRLGDEFASSSDKRRGVLRTAAEQSGAQCLEGLVGGEGSISVCGKDFIADFRFDGGDVKADFKHLEAENGANEGEASKHTYIDVDADFERMVKLEELDELRAAFDRLLKVESLATTLGAEIHVLRVPLQRFEDDVISAFGLLGRATEVKQTARGLTIAYHERCFPNLKGTSEDASAYRRIAVAMKHVARLGLEPTSRKQKFLVSSSEPRAGTEEDDMEVDGEVDRASSATGRPRKKIIYKAAQLADIAACFVLVLDPAVFVSHSVALALSSIVGDLPIADSDENSTAESSAVLVSANHLAQAAGSSRRTLSSLLRDKSFERKDEVLAVRCATPQGVVTLTLGLAEEEAGFKVSRVPICHPRDVERVIGLLKQQLVYNELLESCICGKIIDETQSTVLPSGSALPSAVEVVTRFAPSFVQFDMACGKDGKDVASMQVTIDVGGEVHTTVRVINAQGQDNAEKRKKIVCSDSAITSMLARSRCVPLVIAKMWSLAKF